MNVAAIILSGSTSLEKISMTQTAVNSVVSNKHNIDIYVVDSHRHVTYKGAKVFFNGLAFNYNRNLRDGLLMACLLYTSPSPRDRQKSRMPSSA